MNDKSKNIVKIQNPENFKYLIHDFHCHIAEDLEFNLLKYNIRSMSLMPSWINLNTYNFSYVEENNFTEISNYLNGINNFENRLMKWHGKIYKYLPIDFFETPESLEQLIHRYHINGLKIHPLQNFQISFEKLNPFFKVIRDKNLILYIHTDWIPSTNFGKVKNLLSTTFVKIAKLFPKIPIIMGHSGNNDSYLSIWKIMKKYSNVYAETSLAPTPQELEKVIHHIGPDRLIFGSNYPFCSTSVEIMKIEKLFNISSEIKQKILYSNAIDLYKKMEDKGYD